MDDSFSIPSHWYDGQSARRHTGLAVWDGGNSLVLQSDWGERRMVSVSDLKPIDQRQQEVVYALHSEPDFRLTFADDLPAGFAAALPQAANYGGFVDRIGLGKATLAFAAISAAVLALFLTAPDWLGPRVPESWERKMGDALIGDFGNRLCHTPAGDAAIAKLVKAVDPASQKVRVGVANTEMVNALALPGGQVLIFDGLIQDAESAEEIAGVLAHEVGHVRERHVMTALLRQFGLSILASGFNSGFAEGAYGLASMGYSREAEREADEYARQRLRMAGISPQGVADFFERLGGGENRSERGDDVVGWIATHPSSGERAQAFRDAADSNRSYPPVLSKAEFDALKTMCAQDDDVEQLELFF